MTKRQPLEPGIVNAIMDHNNVVIEACDAAISKLRKIPKHSRTEAVNRNLFYWKSAKSAIVWANSLAKQRMGAAINVQ